MRRTEISSLAVDGNPELCFGPSSPPKGPMAADATPPDLVETPRPNWEAAWIDLGGEG